jgi:hypothetical protein
MYTKFKDKKTGIITFFRTQQYEIGTYLIIDDDPYKQMSLDVKEEIFHQRIRKDKKVEILETY